MFNTSHRLLSMAWRLKKVKSKMTGIGRCCRKETHIHTNTTHWCLIMENLHIETKAILQETLKKKWKILLQHTTARKA